MYQSLAYRDFGVDLSGLSTNDVIEKKSQRVNCDTNMSCDVRFLFPMPLPQVA